MPLPVVNNTDPDLNGHTLVTTDSGMTAGALLVGFGGSRIGLGNLSGDVTTAGGTATTLAASGVVAGTYGSATQVGQVTVDAKGRVTAASNVAIALANMVTHTGALTAGKTVIGNGAGDITISSLTATVVKSTAGTESAATPGTDYVAPGGALGTPSSGVATNLTGLPLTTGVTGVLPVANGGTGVSSDFAPLRVKTAILNDSDIANLPTVHFVLIPAPGPGFAIHPIGGVAFAKLTGGAYGMINVAATLNIQYGTTNLAPAWNWIVNDAAITNGSTTLLTDWLGSTTPKRAALVPYMSTEGLDNWGPLPILATTATMIENQPIAVDVDNAGAVNFSGGDPANTLTFILFYVIVAVP